MVRLPGTLDRRPRLVQVGDARRAGRRVHAVSRLQPHVGQRTRPGQRCTTRWLGCNSATASGSAPPPPLVPRHAVQSGAQVPGGRDRPGAGRRRTPATSSRFSIAVVSVVVERLRLTWTWRRRGPRQPPGHRAPRRSGPPGPGSPRQCRPRVPESTGRFTDCAGRRDTPGPIGRSPNGAGTERRARRQEHVELLDGGGPTRHGTSE